MKDIVVIIHTTTSGHVKDLPDKASFEKERN